MPNTALPQLVIDLMQAHSLAELPYQHFSVTGSDAFDFLQGQLTLDITNIDDKTCLPAGYCNHKGQLFGVLWLYKNDETMHFFVHETVADKVIKRLSMFVLRSDVTFTQKDLMTLVLSPAKAHSLSDDLPQRHGERRGQFVRVGHEAHYFLVFPGLEIFDDADVTFEQVDFAYSLMVCTGALDIIEQTYEKLLPFQGGLGELGGISYDKGCYVGQEVIAINKYRGRNDKHLTLGIIEGETTASLTTGEMLRDDDGKALGTLTNFDSTDNHLYLQVIMSERTIGTEVTLRNQQVTFERIFTQP